MADGILATNAGRACAYFAVDYAFQIGNRFALAADKLSEELATSQIGMGPCVFDFPNPSKRFHLMLSAKRLNVETLGLGPWLDNLDSHLALIGEALKCLEVQELNRIGFKITSFLPIGMTQAETIDLIFGSLMGPKDDLSPILGADLDPLLHIEGRLSNIKYNLDVSAMSSDQSGKSFLRIPHLSKCIESPHTDPGIRDMHSRICSTDNFLFDMDLYMEKVPVSRYKTFPTEAMNIAESVASGMINYIKTKPT